MLFPKCGKMKNLMSNKLFMNFFTFKNYCMKKIFRNMKTRMEKLFSSSSTVYSLKLKSYFRQKSRRIKLKIKYKLKLIKILKFPKIRNRFKKRTEYNI